MNPIKFTIFCFFISVMATSPLDNIYKNLARKQNQVRMQQLMEFIHKNVPEGLEAPNPKIAEFETFKSNKMYNFVDDGQGHLQFRQFRRLRLGDILSRHQAGI
ncbi:unnamed protein product, partial [Mesorhabditis belari]|uniref:Uncharacterized protein n=1 Tax=Mesorhabditis belari TaxID=2138241 RepID=A0AAF3EEZ9_9BILA